ncbi:MAG: glycoside hydrolase family 5 protein, partial [Candidatus Dormibacteraeota bacterium]|nr:glycoside hydrolase family 5 protein [Candidatus Dormibacteraeota bacterium]
MSLTPRLVRLAGILGAAAILAGSVTAPAVGIAALAPSPPRQLQFLHVGALNPTSKLTQVVDQSGREVRLKGVNADGLVDYWQKPPTLPNAYSVQTADYGGSRCPRDDPDVEGVPLCPWDIPQMRALGFNVIRLNLSWSLAEPGPGQISAAYLDRVAQAVEWARAEGIYVVLDMHQDAWSKYIYTPAGQACPPPFRAVRGYDGAPAWASTHTAPACALNGVRELDPAVDEDFDKFYKDLAAPGDSVGLQERFVGVLTALAGRFKNDPTVAGYELLNEPSPTTTEHDPQLIQLWGKMVNAVVAATPGFRQLFFFEPSVLRDVVDTSLVLQPWSLASPYPNAVYAPHIYTGVFTADVQVTQQRLLPSNGGYQSSIRDAQNLGLPLWVGEFGNDPADDDTILRGSYQQQDQYMLGGAYWLWKENANDINRSLFWGLYGKPFDNPPYGVPQPKKIKFSARAYPMTTAGQLTQMTYDPDTAGFDIRAVTTTAVAAGDRLHAMSVFVPPASHCDVEASNASLDVFDRGGGSREAYIYPAAGSYRVFCGTVGA